MGCALFSELKTKHKREKRGNSMHKIVFEDYQEFQVLGIALNLKDYL